MTRIAILGGGISGLTAAYELELARKRGAAIDWHLYEATGRLGGIVETTRRDGFILEGGPDGWVTEKPWARELAIDLGLGSELISSNDATRKTCIFIDGRLQPMPDRMRMMVPEDLSTLEDSPLFSNAARQAYANELTWAHELRSAAPKEDESVASFVHRHFGEEVLAKIAAPLLSGVFGGDIAKLSVRAVLPAFVAMEREHGSLIAALQATAKTRSGRPPQSIFTSLRNGVGTLIDALVAQLPPDRLHLNRPALSLKRERNSWCLRTSTPSEKGRPGKSKKHFNHIVFATPIDVTHSLLHPLDPEAAAQIPSEASSAVLVAFAWPAETASTFTIPPGFGFLVPQSHFGSAQNSDISTGAQRSEKKPASKKTDSSSIINGDEPQLLATTFVDRKFPHRAPSGARILRAFFGGPSADTLASQSDAVIVAAAFTQLTEILGPMPQPEAGLTTIRRWPRSLPQYEVGHLERIAELDRRIATLGNLTLLGNGYRGVGLPDLIRDSRASIRALVTVLSSSAPQSTPQA